MGKLFDPQRGAYNSLHAGAVTKRSHAEEFGWPTEVQFFDALAMYRRHPLARSAVDRTASKTWQSAPQLRYTEEGALTPMEEAVNKRLKRIRFWQSFYEADKRSIVGGYGGLVVRVADDLKMDRPAGRVTGGIQSLVEIIPCWQHQLVATDYITDLKDVMYGRPSKFQFVESAVKTETAVPRHYAVHPSRVMVLSRDGTVNDRSQLEAGFNCLIDSEKISGAGGEGFFKNAKRSPVISTAEDDSLGHLAQGMGVDMTDLSDKMTDVVRDWSAGFDAALLLSKMKAEFPGVTLPEPMEYWEICAMSFAASMQMPFKILIGMITGERASTEDAEEWARTCEARRSNEIVPLLEDMIDRFVEIGVLPAEDWRIEWDGLIEDGPGERIERAKMLSEVNQAEADEVFTIGEIREAAGYDSQIELDQLRDDFEGRGDE